MLLLKLKNIIGDGDMGYVIGASIVAIICIFIVFKIMKRKNLKN